MKLITEYISPSSKNHLLSLNIRISSYFQTRSVVRNSNKYKLFQRSHVQCLQKQENIISKFAATNTS